MATVTTNSLHLCGCCAIAAANADVSGCEDFHGHRPHALSSPFLAQSLGKAGSLVVTGESPDVGYFECDGCAETSIGAHHGAAILDGATD